MIKLSPLARLIAWWIQRKADPAMWTKVLKVAKGAAIAAGGAALAYLVAVDWSEFGPVIAAVASVALNALYQLIKKGE